MSKKSTLIKGIRAGLSGAILALLFLGCTGEKSAVLIEQPGFLVGFAAEIITPQLIETEWTDYNGNMKFNGDINNPAGDPIDCNGGDCDEPFKDVNGNGKFDAVWMAGFDEATPIISVSDDIEVRCTAFQNQTRIIICSADLIGWLYPDFKKVRERLHAAGVEFDYLSISSTHNHQGPDTMGIWGPDLFTSGLDEGYISFVTDKMVAAAKGAVDNLVPARFEVIAGDDRDIERPEQTNNRFPAGFIGDSRDPMIVDNTITAMRFFDREDRTLGTIVHWSSHPEVSVQRRRELTSDYPHYIRERMEQRFGGLSVFWIGPIGGLMTPIGFNSPLYDESGAPVYDGDGAPVIADDRSVDEVRSYGFAVAEFAADLLEENSTDGGLDPEVAFSAAEIFLPAQNELFILGGSLGLIHVEGYFENGDQIPLEDKIPPTGNVYTKTEIAYIRIGPVGVLTIPGEGFPENWIGAPTDLASPERQNDYYTGDPSVHNLPYTISSVWRDLVAEQFPIGLGLANDELGYIVPHEDFNRDFYEESVCVGPNTESLLNRGYLMLTTEEPTNSIEPATKPPAWDSLPIKDQK